VSGRRDELTSYQLLNNGPAEQITPRTSTGISPWCQSPPLNPITHAASVSYVLIYPSEHYGLMLEFHRIRHAPWRGGVWRRQSLQVNAENVTKADHNQPIVQPASCYSNLHKSSF
jgi:hypothetical protein